MDGYWDPKPKYIARDSFKKASSDSGIDFAQE